MVRSGVQLIFSIRVLFAQRIFAPTGRLSSGKMTLTSPLGISAAQIMPQLSTPHSFAGFRFATADEIKAIADRGEFLHYDSIRKVFE